MSDAMKHIPPPDAAAIMRPRRRMSFIWIVPALAALIGLSMVVHAWLSAGPEISIAFQTAEGLEVDKTPVKYKDVTVGVVSAIALSDDGSHVIATVALDKHAENLARADTRFWVVRPRIGLQGVSGIDTLLSGAYIGVDKGTSRRPGTSFVGQETPPTIIHGTPGRSFVLHANDLGSLDVGSPVYYRRIRVGRVASYRLDADGRDVTLELFVDAPYDRFVTASTRFWHASGVDITLGADGLKLDTQSFATVLAGGIAFANPVDAADAPAPAQAVFDLAKDQRTAMAPPDGPAQYLQLRFEDSLRGLAVDAPVEFAGKSVGRVVSLDLDYDAGKRRFPTVVGIVIYPTRLGGVLARLPKYSGSTQQRVAAFLANLIQHGLRAQARSGNLLTGQLYISLGFVPNAARVAFDPEARPIAIPTVPGSFDHMQEQVASIVSKIEKMPLDAIGRHLDASLVDLDTSLRQVNGNVLPATTKTLQQADRTFQTLQGTFGDNAPLQQNLLQALMEIQRTAQSVRTFTDMLGRHPEALIKGLPSDEAATYPSSLHAAHPEHTR
jgi:paraquat-inducible protein B